MDTFRLQSGGVSLLLKVFNPQDAREYGLDTWSLKYLQQQGDVAGNAILAKVLFQELYGLGVSEAFAPNVAPASGQIVGMSDLTDRILLRKGVLCRNQNLPADGVFIDPGRAFVMSAAGCPVIIATCGPYLIVAHAARDSLIDRGAIIGTPTRKHLSVVDAIIEKFHQRGTPRDITMTMLFARPARTYEHSAQHPEYGNYNRELAAFIDARWPGGIAHEEGSAFLDLEQLFVEQARQAGIKKVWSSHSLSQYPHFAYTSSGPRGHERNLFIIKRERPLAQKQAA